MGQFIDFIGSLFESSDPRPKPPIGKSYAEYYGPKLSTPVEPKPKLFGDGRTYSYWVEPTQEDWNNYYRQKEIFDAWAERQRYLEIYAERWHEEQPMRQEQERKKLDSDFDRITSKRLSFLIKPFRGSKRH